MHQRLPRFRVGTVPTRTGTVLTTIQCGQSAHQQTLGGAATGKSPAQQSRGEDARVVHNEQVASVQQVGKLNEATVRDRAGSSIERQQARRAAVGQRFLSDELGR